MVGKREGKRQLVARMGDTGGAGRVWWGNVRERDSFEDLPVDRSINLKEIG